MSEYNCKVDLIDWNCVHTIPSCGNSFRLSSYQEGKNLEKIKHWNEHLFTVVPSWFLTDLEYFGVGGDSDVYTQINMHAWISALTPAATKCSNGFLRN
eukprot:5136569-Amphidinium_carterae.1